MLTIRVKGGDVVYWGDLNRLLHEIAETLGVEPNRIEIQLGEDTPGTTLPPVKCPRIEASDVYFLDPFSWELPPNGMPE